jgi:hypothetical protein
MALFGTRGIFNVLPAGPAEVQPPQLLPTWHPSLSGQTLVDLFDSLQAFVESPDSSQHMVE